jgi:hypothetical protein
MRLQDFERETRGRTSRFVAPVADTTGAESYELVLAGDAKGLETIFKEADFGASIDPGRGFEETEREFADAFADQAERHDEMARLDKLDELPLFKAPPPAPDPAKSVFVSLRRRGEGKGTFWGPWTFPYFLPQGWNIWIWPPPLCSLSACVTPSSGDQDLFLFRNGIFLSILSASVRGGTATDCVGFSNPPLTGCSIFTWNFLALRILGFTAGAGTFTMRGFS